MKLSTKLFCGSLALVFGLSIAHRLAIVTAFGQKTRVDFGPETVAKTVQPFKKLVFETTLDVNSNIELKPSDSFAVGASADFWKTFEVDQQGETLVIRQIADRLEDAKGQPLGFAGLTVLAPAELVEIRTDGHVDLLGFRGDSLRLELLPLSKKRGRSTVKNVALRSLSIQTSDTHSVEFDKASRVENFRLDLRDSSYCKLECPVSGRIWFKSDPGSHFSTSGANLARVVRE